ncbi:metallophosphoesterase [Sutcliffiella halmapala]|uniref:metallophosphoesterase n=1 Tax=Sutcliffiella halmapala TaxID=79882 RepID=UPI000994D6C6|nr:metallophosphoesterase [Sutcliffiella halmapala]
MYYLGWNVWVYLRVIFEWESPIIYSILLALIAYSYILGRLIKSLSWLSVVGSYWFALVQYGLLLFPLANLTVYLLNQFPIDERSAIIWTGSITLLLLLLLFIVGTYNAYSPVIRHYEIAISKEIENLKELRIAVASDMHFGKLSGRAHVNRLVKTVEKIKPDLILLPGDIIDDDPKQFVRKKMGEILKQLQAPLGVYGVLGNHEYYGREIPAFLEEMEKLDIRILMDEVININNSFYLLGRKDKTDARRKSFTELVDGLEPGIPIIAMDHQPAELKEAEVSGIDLILSGHTHRGQMAPNHFITRKIFELDWGYLKKNKLHAIVSSGFGFWGPPIRIGSRSEVVEITVKFLKA